jgi:hypothetical protein
VLKIELVGGLYKGRASQMNPTTETVFKTTTAIKKNLELVAKASAYLTFIRNASTGEHLELELGDQLRATSDYNGSIFEVVKKPYECIVNQDGNLSDYERKYKHRVFRSFEEDEANKALEYLLANREADVEGWEIEEAHIVRENFPLGRDDDEHSDDEWEEIDAETYHFRLVWTLRTLPAGHRKEQRIWVRKICLISKAEGLTDDKNFRSLVLTQKTVPFTDLIKQQMDLLQKVSRSLEHTRPTDEKSRKMAGWVVNEKRCSELRKLWWNPALKNKTLTAYSNTKYGLFLRNPVTYTITASGKNVMVQTTDKMLDARKEVAQVAEAKESVVKQLKKGKKDEGCLITDD